MLKHDRCLEAMVWAIFAVMAIAIVATVIAGTVD